MENKVFKMEVLEEDTFDEKTKCIIFLHLPKEAKDFINDLIFTKMSLGYTDCSLTSIFDESMEILKEKFPNIPNNKALKRRYYKGGNQKNKGELYRTSIISNVGNKNWIDNYILHQVTTKGDIYFSSKDFVNDIVEELKIKYAGKLKKIPKRKII